MKKILNIIAISLSLILFQSCDEELFEAPLNNVVSFEQEVYTTSVEVAGTTEVVVNVWTNSSSGETYNLSVDLDNTTGDPGSYTVPSSVTIPSGSKTASFTVTLSDVNLGDAVNSLVINFASQNNVTRAGSTTIIYVLFCAFDINNFVGTYTADQGGSILL